MKKYKSIHKNKYCSILLSSTVWFIPIRTFLIRVGDMIHIGWGGYCSKLSIILFLLLLVVPMLKSFKITKDLMLCICFVALSWLISFAFHIEYAGEWIREWIRIFVKAIPFYLFVQNINDWSETKQIMYKAAIITVVVMLSYTILGKYTNTLFAEGYQYDQFSGIITAGSASICVIAWLDEKKWIHFFMMILALGMILLFGARMPMMCMAFSMILFMLCRMLKQQGTDRFRISYKGFYILIVLYIFLLIGMVAIHFMMNQEMNHIKEGQRIIYQIINGEFFKSNGRIAIYVAAIKSIYKRPLLGYGIISDRIPIAASYYGNMDNFVGTYAHNMFLELWLQYGLILGSILIGIMLIVVIKLILDIRMQWDKKMIAIYAIAMAFGILLFSGPVYSNKEFWIMMGLGIPYFVRVKKKHA